MSIEFRVASVDGFGDRDDIALARDKQQGQIKENQAIAIAATHDAIVLANTYGSSNSPDPISKIVLKMLSNNCYQKIILKSQLFWDVESLSEAVNDACIILGLNEDEFSPSLCDNGNEIDIRLV